MSRGGRPPGSAEQSWAASNWHRLDLAGLIGAAPREGALLLSVGCACGAERSYEEKAGYRVVAFDIYPTQGTDLLADGHHLPFKARTFDVATAFEVLEHVKAPWTVVHQIARVLRPGGRFAGSVAFLKPFHDSYFHMTHWGVAALLEDAGFRVDRVRGGQNVFVHVVGRMLPLGRFANRFWNRFDRTLAFGRRSLWRLKHRMDPAARTDRFDPGFELSFDDFQSVQFGASILFSATLS